ncbi:Rieske 2Fe-2S domain-containing protein [Serratia sp. (in: enterobacteria)]|uniref:Rieske 2Fe-2S domain-containing protein n=1 Tax=Serratia sp. (in: enterobacteria) TaxID=616 RepID=UPI00398A29E7
MTRPTFPYPHLQRYWYPVLSQKQLGQRPHAIQLLDRQLVLVRLAGKVCCFLDSCPHRLVPLSLGHVEQGRLQCCYHGWQFDDQGELRHTPGSQQPACCARLQRFAVKEFQGLIWVRLQEDDGSAPLVAMPEINGMSYRQEYRQVDCGVFHTAENFLDPCHTPYIHRKLLRQSGKQAMTVTQQVDIEEIVTDYALHQRQNGWINRLFDRGIDRNLARFTLPGMIELDYYQQQRLVFKTLLYLIPHQAGRTGMWVRIYLPRSRAMPDGLRFALLRPFLNLLFRQDGQILAIQQQAQQRYGERYLFSPTDMVAKPLWQLLHGKHPQASQARDIEL